MAALVFNCPRCVYRISIDRFTAEQSVQCPCCRQYVLPPGHAPAVAGDPRTPIQHTTESPSNDFDVDERTLDCIRQRKSGESQGATLVFGLIFGTVLAVVVVMIGVFNWWKSTSKKPTIAAKVLAKLERGGLELEQGNLESEQRNLEIRQRNAELRKRHPELEQRNTQPPHRKARAIDTKSKSMDLMAMYGKCECWSKENGMVKISYSAWTIISFSARSRR